MEREGGGAPPEENSDMSWDDLAPTDVCLHTCSPTGSDVTQKKSPGSAPGNPYVA